MKYLKQITLLLAFSFAGEAAHALLPLPVPAAIYGLLLLFAALCLRIINPGQIKESAQWLITVMPILFVAPTVNLAEYWRTIVPLLPPIVVIIAVSTVLTFGVSGKLTQLVLKKGGGRNGTIPCATPL